MEITTLTVGPLQTNCYLLSHSQTNQTIIIDPGEEADFITQEIIQKKLKPILIFLTHGHFDHVLGSLELKLNFDLPLAIHPKDLSLYQQAPQSALYWTKQSSAPVPPPDTLLSPKKPLPSPSPTSPSFTPLATLLVVFPYTPPKIISSSLVTPSSIRVLVALTSLTLVLPISKNPSKNFSNYLLKPKSIPATAIPLP